MKAFLQPGDLCQYSCKGANVCIICQISSFQYKMSQEVSVGHRNLTSSFGAIVCNENSEWTQIQGLPVPQQQEDIETSRLPVIFGIFRALNTNNHHMHTSRQSERSPVTRRELGAGSAGYCEIPPRPMPFEMEKRDPL